MIENGSAPKVCVRTSRTNSVPKGRLRVAQDVVLGILTNSARSGCEAVPLPPRVFAACNPIPFKGVLSSEIKTLPQYSAADRLAPYPSFQIFRIRSR